MTYISKALKEIIITFAGCIGFCLNVSHDKAKNWRANHANA